MEFGEKLKLLREAQHMTQSELAARLNVDRSTISSYETKNHQPSHDKLLLLSKILKVSVDLLINDSYEINIEMLSAPSLKEDEIELLSHYRTLSDTSKRQLKDHAKALNLMDLNDKGLIKILLSDK